MTPRRRAVVFEGRTQREFCIVRVVETGEMAQVEIAIGLDAMGEKTWLTPRDLQEWRAAARTLADVLSTRLPREAGQTS